MIKGEYDKLAQIAKDNVCGKCKAPLEVAWLADADSYVIGCGKCGYTDVVTRHLSNNEAWRAGAPSPEEYRAKENKGKESDNMTNEKQTLPITLGDVPYADLATGEVLTPAQAKGLIDYAAKYHLDPYRGHVVMMHGKPYIGLDGYLFHAAKSGRPYSLSARPLTTDEELQYKVDKLGHNWIATASFIDTGQTFDGLGIVTYEQMTARSNRDTTKLRSPVVAAHPWQLAQKRAEWQAMRRAFPIGESPE